MADPLDPISLNVAGVRDLIGSKTNKSIGGVRSSEEGPITEPVDVLDLPMSDDELLTLKGKWENSYKDYEGKVKKRQEDNKKYYEGKQWDGTPYAVEFPIASNLLFEAEETFLPAALSKNPDPVVVCDNTTEGTAMANDIKTMLQYHADVQILRRKLARMTRHWSIYFIGVLKHGWDAELGDIKTDVRNPKNMLLDPNGEVDVYGDFDSWVGERVSVTADELIGMFPKHKEYISASVKGMLGTDVVYTEWWTDAYCFYTYMDIVLDKHKNPNFNYGTEVEETDEEGQAVKVMHDGKNHFARPKKPYTFLSVFSLGEQPHDLTSLIEQNIPNQNLITKRTMQIDLNLSRQNNSVAFSGDNFNQQTAKQAATAFEKGNPVLVPAGRPINEAIVRFPAEAYPEAAFRELAENKNNLRQSFGTQGITAQEDDRDETARGMILNQQRDSTRIGGGIGDAIEQVADNVFNYWLQLYYVFYDTEHYAAIIGAVKGVEFVTLSQENLHQARRFSVSVVANSMKPRDEVTEMNQAIQLYELGVLDPKTLLTILNVPDAQQTAENTVLWLMDKPSYIRLNFPELAAKLAAQGAPAAPGGAPAPTGAPAVPPSPNANISADPASAALSNVPLPSLPQ